MIIWWLPPASLSGCEYWGSIKYWGLKTPESGMLWFVWAVSTQCYHLLLLTGSTIQFILYFSCIFILQRIPVSCISQQRTKQLRLPSKQLTLNIVSFIVLFISRWQFQAGLITAGYQCSVLYRMVRLYNTSLLPPAADCSDQATTMSENFYNDLSILSPPQRIWLQKLWGKGKMPDAANSNFFFLYWGSVFIWLWFRCSVFIPVQICRRRVLELNFHSLYQISWLETASWSRFVKNEREKCCPKNTG